MARGHNEMCNSKENRLREIIRQAAQSRQSGRVIVAFSGGVDSSLLLWECAQTLGPENVTAVTATSPTSIARDEDAARQFAARLGVSHLVIPTDECSDRRFMENKPDRCYVCKAIRYAEIKRLAEEWSATALDGSQADDDPSDRPGMRALQELGVDSPLALAGLTKQEVRVLLRSAGFQDLAEKNAQPCLATRIPTGNAITLAALEIVRAGEAILRERGFDIVRLRLHANLARIVTDRQGIARLAGDRHLRREVWRRLADLGLDYVSLDMKEYG